MFGEKKQKPKQISFSIDGIGVPRKTAVRAVMRELGLNYAEAGDMLSIRLIVKTGCGVVVRDVKKELDW